LRLVTDDSKKQKEEQAPAKKTDRKKTERSAQAKPAQAKSSQAKSAPRKTPKPVDPAVAEPRAVEVQNKTLIDSSLRIADRINAATIFFIIDDPDGFKMPGALTKRKNFVLVVPEKVVDEDLKKQHKKIITLPHLQLTRMGRIKMTVMKSLAARMIEQGDKIVCLTGARGMPTLDSLVVLDIGKEFELLSSGEVGKMSAQVRTEVFEELVTIATELASQGREGKPVGAIFVLGDTDKVMDLSRQMIFNPFQGYPEEERNILDPRLKDTIKEFASLDGAFIIRDDGVVMAAGRHLNASLEDASLPQGLGARHAAAAGITDVTNATAVVISESTGTVRIFRSGSIFMEIEKAPALKR